MAKFIVLHKEVMREHLEKVEVLINIEQIANVYACKSNYTHIGLTGTYIEVTESYEEVVRLINRSDYR